MLYSIKQHIEFFKILINSHFGTYEKMLKLLVNWQDVDKKHYNLTVEQTNILKQLINNAFIEYYNLYILKNENIDGVSFKDITYYSNWLNSKANKGDVSKLANFYNKYVLKNVPFRLG